MEIKTSATCHTQNDVVTIKQKLREENNDKTTGKGPQL